MYLPDGSGGVGCFLKVFEQLAHGLAQFAFHLVQNHLEGHGWGFFLEFFQCLGELLGQEVLGLGGNLAHFHDGALELTQGVGNLVGHAGVAFAAGAFVIHGAEHAPCPLAGVLAGHRGSHAGQLEESTCA